MNCKFTYYGHREYTLLLFFFCSIIRHKFGSFRRKRKSSDESLSRNLSLEKLTDCKITLFKHDHSQDEITFREEDSEGSACTKSESDLLDDKQKKRTTLVETFNSGSSTESYDVPHDRCSVSCSHDHSNPDDSTLKHPDRSLGTRPGCDVNENSSIKDHDYNNHCCEDKTCTNLEVTNSSLKKVIYKDEQTEKKCARRNMSERNSFTNAMKQFFVSKAR